MKRMMLALMIALGLAGAAQAQTEEEMLRELMEESERECRPAPRIRLPSEQQIGSVSANTLVGSIYDQNRATAILETGQCSCDTLFPSWEGAIAEFETRFGDLPPDGPLPQAVLDYQDQSRKQWDEAHRICVEQGVKRTYMYFENPSAEDHRVSAAGCVVPGQIKRPERQISAEIDENDIVRSIYNLNRANTILENNQCTCSKLHPSWDGAVAEFEARFGGLPTSGPVPQEVLDLDEQSDAAWDKARGLCRAQEVN
jgi:hypothetical protein